MSEAVNTPRRNPVGRLARWLVDALVLRRPGVRRVAGDAVEELLDERLDRLVAASLARSNRVLGNGERYDPVHAAVTWWDPAHVERYLFAARRVGPEDEVLDVACGVGYGVAMLASVARRCVGVDANRDALLYAQAVYHRPNTEYVQGDLLALERRADVVVSFETLEHLGVDLAVGLQKLAGAARRCVIGSVPYRERPGANPHHQLFEIAESSLAPLAAFGRLELYYQQTDGAILDALGASPMNLVFVASREP